ncbi:MAG: hypothetical protein GF344_06340 [Chitinivibrionales bacterium]|nr:hypothetical protein [Chitinivibrionales bacterium]
MRSCRQGIQRDDWSLADCVAALHFLNNRIADSARMELVQIPRADLADNEVIAVFHENIYDRLPDVQW